MSERPAVLKASCLKASCSESPVAPTKPDPVGEMIRYDKVTVHFQGETGPMAVRGVAEFTKSAPLGKVPASPGSAGFSGKPSRSPCCNLFAFLHRPEGLCLL
jgi:hypothetical protein